MRMAADLGVPDAQIDLGNAYVQGLGIGKDIEEALWYYREAAELGHRDAQFALGTLYLLGKDVEKDISSAIYWYYGAAEQGHLDALGTLGRLYFEGKDVERDIPKTHILFLTARMLGSEDADLFVEELEKELPKCVVRENRLVVYHWLNQNFQLLVPGEAGLWGTQEFILWGRANVKI